VKGSFRELKPVGFVLMGLCGHLRTVFVCGEREQFGTRLALGRCCSIVPTQPNEKIYESDENE